MSHPARQAHYENTGYKTNVSPDGFSHGDYQYNHQSLAK